MELVEVSAAHRVRDKRSRTVERMKVIKGIKPVELPPPVKLSLSHALVKLRHGSPETERQHMPQPQVGTRL